MDNSGVLINCEYGEGKLAPITLELLGIGGKLAKELGQDLSAILIGQNVGDLAKEAVAYGANKVYVVDDPLLKDYLTDSYSGVMEKVIKLAQPQIVLLGQTPMGRDLTPRLAFRLNTGATMDTVALSIDPASKRMLQTKPVYGGNAQVVQVCEINPQIATIRSKAMTPAARDANRKGEVIVVAAGIDPSKVRTKIIERKTEAAAGIKLEEAKLIVSGGRGMSGADGFKQLAELAGVLKGALGASRPPCDNKWVPDSLQVGLTGKIVSPDVYIAVAISGSSQHLSGCSGSKVIIAINKDPEANIFKVANFGVIGDWKKVVPAFTAKCKELAG
jgi:caffeyl-CoA reductase-Etf complex subunit CarE